MDLHGIALVSYKCKFVNCRVDQRVKNYSCQCCGHGWLWAERTKLLQNKSSESCKCFLWHDWLTEISDSLSWFSNSGTGFHATHWYWKVDYSYLGLYALHSYWVSIEVPCVSHIVQISAFLVLDMRTKITSTAKVLSLPLSCYSTWCGSFMQTMKNEFIIHQVI